MSAVRISVDGLRHETTQAAALPAKGRSYVPGVLAVLLAFSHSLPWVNAPVNDAEAQRPLSDFFGRLDARARDEEEIVAPIAKARGRSRCGAYGLVRLPF